MKCISYLFSALCVLAAVMYSCNDDDAELERLRQRQEQLESQMRQLQERLTRLEAAVTSFNSDLLNLQNLLIAEQKKEYITGVLPVIDNGVEVGYTLVFA